MLFTGNILKHPDYKNIKHRISGSLENTNAVLEKTFFLGMYPGLEKKYLDYMVNTIYEFFKSNIKIVVR